MNEEIKITYAGVNNYKLNSFDEFYENAVLKEAQTRIFFEQGEIKIASLDIIVKKNNGLI